MSFLANTVKSRYGEHSWRGCGKIAQKSSEIVPQGAPMILDSYRKNRGMGALAAGGPFLTECGKKSELRTIHSTSVIGATFPSSVPMKPSLIGVPARFGCDQHGKQILNKKGGPSPVLARTKASQIPEV